MSPSHHDLTLEPCLCPAWGRGAIVLCPIRSGRGAWGLANPPEALCATARGCDVNRSRAGQEGGGVPLSPGAPPWLVSLVLATPRCGRYLMGSRRGL